jgi:hypothetical protein
MAFPRKQGIRVEVVRFNGRTYRRYPDSSNYTHRRYFSRTGALLHRDVWEFYNGPIPKGWHVHHKDGDPSNNDISNLECLPPHEHAAEHSDARRDYGRSAKQLEHLARVRNLAAQWHGSEEGLAWHREHAKESLARARAARGPAPVRTCTCVQCGRAFEARSEKAKYCSDECAAARHNQARRAASLGQRSGYRCVECGGEFVAAKSGQKFCSTKCRYTDGNRRKRSRVQPQC